MKTNINCRNSLLLTRADRQRDNYIDTYKHAYTHSHVTMSYMSSKAQLYPENYSKYSTTQKTFINSNEH